MTSSPYPQAPQPNSGPHMPRYPQQSVDVASHYGVSQMPMQGSNAINSPLYPSDLFGCVPVSLGKRVAARAIDILLVGVLTVLVVVGILLATDRALDVDIYADAGATFISFILLCIYCPTGWLPGGRLLGVRDVRFSQPRVPGWRGLLKHILRGLSSLLLAIPFLVIVFGTRDELGRHAIDRVSDVIVIDVKAGRDPLKSQ